MCIYVCTKFVSTVHACSHPVHLPDAPPSGEQLGEVGVDLPLRVHLVVVHHLPSLTDRHPTVKRKKGCMRF